MATKPFEAAVRRGDGGAAILDLEGDINASAEQALNSVYAAAEATHPASLILNFSRVGYINSTGIALIVGLLARARKARLPLLVFGLSPHYQEIFQITRLADFMSIYADEASALAQRQSA
jgi:anti-sigma B factor antagonist